MTKRKGEAYLGGSTVITLHPKTVEMGIAEQAREYRQQRNEDQQAFDALLQRRQNAALQIVHKNRVGRNFGEVGIEKYYRDQIHQIEVLLKGKIDTKRLRLKQLDLLEKLLKVLNLHYDCHAGVTRKVIRRMREVERLLAKES